MQAGEQLLELEDSGNLLQQPSSDFWTAIKDYFLGFQKSNIWMSVALMDIQKRYRRTLIGPFWTTLSLAIFVSSMGVLFSLLWHTKPGSFLPYFASGFICWTFFSTMVTEGCSSFLSAESLLKQVPLPYATFAWLVVARNFLVLLHQSVVFVVIALIFHVPVTWDTLLVIPALLLLCLNGSWIALLFGILCARYRDTQQVIASLLQISMFVTPIFWPEKQLGHGFHAYLLINGNPLYHYVVILRKPLLGQAPSLMNWGMVLLFTLLGWLLAMWAMGKSYRKLIFWV